MLSRLQILVSCAAAASLGLTGCVTEFPSLEQKELRERYEAQWREINARITNCAVCSGQVVKVKSVPSSRSAAQSKNMVVWNESICFNPFADPESPICKNCWHVFIPSNRSGREMWTRVMPSAAVFKRPLSPAIQNAPTPGFSDHRYHLIYTQTYRSNRFEESVAFGCRDSTSLRARLSAYESTNQVRVKIHQPGPGLIGVEIATRD